MPTLLAQLTPQRSTPYSDLTAALAPHELMLSPLGSLIIAMHSVQLGGQSYLKVETTAAPSEMQRSELGGLAMTNAYFEYFDGAADLAGPLLRPLETHFQPTFPIDLITARRYRGKTNETFTQFMLNLARFSSDFAHRPWSALRVFDPLCGGGTTLFVALVLGADVMGVERGKEEVETTAAFIEQYAREQGVACEVRRERLKKQGRRWQFNLGPSHRQCVIARGETTRSAELMIGMKPPHLIVTDLPYGIQHRGELTSLLSTALPVWSSMLVAGGALTFAWESARFPRGEMIALVESAGGLRVLNDPPYDRLAHRVDRVIKQRDVIVAKKAQRVASSE